MKAVNLEGVAFIGECVNMFQFAPDDPVPGRVRSFRKHGVAQQMSDGTFDFEARPWQRSEAKLIRKLAHGRVSETKDGAVRLTLTVYKSEGINIIGAICKEALQAVSAIRDYQLRK